MDRGGSCTAVYRANDAIAVYQEVLILMIVRVLEGENPGQAGWRRERGRQTRQRENLIMSSFTSFRYARAVVLLLIGNDDGTGVGYSGALGAARGPVRRQDLQHRFIGARQVWQVKMQHYY